MTKNAQSPETKRLFSQAVVLALKVYEDKERVDTWLKTPAPEFGGNSPMQLLMFGHGTAVVGQLKVELTAKNKVSKIRGEVEAAATEARQIQESHAEPITLDLGSL